MGFGGPCRGRNGAVASRRVRFNSDSDVSVGRVGWRAFATVTPSSVVRCQNRMQQKARASGGVTWRPDNAGEMCTGIIFPGKCGVIEKKEEGATRWRMLQVIRTLFREGERRQGKKRRTKKEVARARTRPTFALTSLGRCENDDRSCRCRNQKQVCRRNVRGTKG